MPIRGESVGTAYIRLIADGSGVPDDIRDSFKGTEDFIEDAGHKDGERYRKAFAEELEKHDNDALQDAFARALANDKATEEFFKSSRWKKLEARFVGQFGDLGQKEADSMRARFLKAGNLDGIEESITSSVGRLNRALDQSIADRNSALAKANADMEKFERDFRRSMEEAEKVSRNVSQDNVNNLEALRRTLERLRSGAILPFARDLNKARATINDTSTDIDRNGSAFARFAVTIDHIAESVGRAFGRGSRNDFLNFTGSFIRNSVSLLGLPARLIGNVSEFGTAFKEARVLGDGFFKSIRAGFTGAASDAEGAGTALSSFISSGLVSLPLLAAAMVAIISVLGVVASLISGIVAALIAMVATISFGIVGALAPLVGLLSPIALGIGTIVLGITTLDDKSKKALSKAIKPLTQGLKDLGAAARDGFLNTFDRSLDSIAAKLQRFDPLVRAIGRAFGTVGNQIVDSFDSPTLSRFINQFTVFAPRAIESLSTSLGNLAKAFTEIFTDSIPLTRRFLHFLEDITGQFAEFVTQNPQKVIDFLSTAAGAARVLGRFLGAVVRLFSTLITSGLDTGNSIFESLTNNINEFTDTLKPKAVGPTVFDEAAGGIKRFQDNIDKIPKEDPLANFFANGKQTADDLGNIAVSLGIIAGALDSEDTRQILHFLADLAVKASALAGPIAFLSQHPLSLFFGPLGAFVELVKPALPIIGDAAQNVRSFAQSIGELQDKFTFKGGLGGKIADFFKKFQGGGGITPLAIKPPSLDWIPNVLGKIRGFAADAGRPFAQVTQAGTTAFNNLISPARIAVSDIARIFSNLPTRLQNLTSQFNRAAGNWAEGIYNAIVDLPGRLVGLFFGLGGRIADAIGTINLHISAPDLPGGKFNPLNLLSASGGVFDGAQWRVIGEAGPEAVVPLSGPLSQVDPAVRWLAALARGGPGAQGVPASTIPSGKTINNEFHLTTSTVDVEAVANELLNQMVATAY